MAQSLATLASPHSIESLQLITIQKKHKNNRFAGRFNNHLIPYQLKLPLWKITKTEKNKIK